MGLTRLWAWLDRGRLLVNAKIGGSSSPSPPRSGSARNGRAPWHRDGHILGARRECCEGPNSQTRYRGSHHPMDCRSLEHRKHRIRLVDCSRRANLLTRAGAGVRHQKLAPDVASAIASATSPTIPATSENISSRVNWRIWASYSHTCRHIYVLLMDAA